MFSSYLFNRVKQNKSKLYMYTSVVVSPTQDLFRLEMSNICQVLFVLVGFLTIPLPISLDSPLTNQHCEVKIW